MPRQYSLEFRQRALRLLDTRQPAVRVSAAQLPAG